jgi:hypothetical protein
LVSLARRRTGVKNGGGTARDVVAFLVRSRPRISLTACFERGTITPRLVATPEFRIIRLHTRYRRDLTDERAREKQRVEKLLESAQRSRSPRS